MTNNKCVVCDASISDDRLRCKVCEGDVAQYGSHPNLWATMLSGYGLTLPKPKKPKTKS